MNIEEKIRGYQQELSTTGARLIAISKTKPTELILEAYAAGQRDFGENKVQDLAKKFELLPKDIRWHMVGHLQRNKVKYLAPFVHLIHSVDSPRLLQAIDKEAKKVDRKQKVLLQLHVAQEETKFGFTTSELQEYLGSSDFGSLENIEVCGLMAMASNVADEQQISEEFTRVRKAAEEINASGTLNNAMTELSMGMSGDYRIALACGSTMIRIGTDIFGARNYG